ncbi:MAG: N-acetylmuramoyl-L-alanine amidase [Polycyclovorans sp.]|nr:N-acetylmuramoyl-L-alanine amidase [Polycyclovorans sp.]|tara:strand:- start:36534 stop:37694 length:1161 start_codon:yes stop_codon:yes gene_type:complete
MLSLLVVMTRPAVAAELRDVRLWAGPESTRVVFDLDGAVQHSVFTLDNPHRIVIDLHGMSPESVRVANRAAGQGVVQRIRSGKRDEKTVRVVLDVNQPITPRSFSLTPSDQFGHRVVLDLDVPLSMPTARVQKPAVTLGEKLITIAVDAGHGGEDPGAIGPAGTREKDVSLVMARRLAALIDAQPGMRAVLTRSGDYSVGLQRRVEVAREYQADLFVSIHANAFRKRELRGSSVYVLSNRGASSEHARWLARRENAADLVGGIEIASKDSDLASVLIDLSQSASLEASFDLGGRILNSLGQINRLQKTVVQQAGFMVLKAPDIPSVLVETAFISNPQEERLLRDPKHQERFAKSIMAGIRGYFDHYRPQMPVVQSADSSLIMRDLP